MDSPITITITITISVLIPYILPPSPFAIPAYPRYSCVQYAVDFVKSCGDNVAATITPHHLLCNRNALFAGGLRPHYYCLPVLKTEIDRLALLEAASSGNFFMGLPTAIPISISSSTPSPSPSPSPSPMLSHPSWMNYQGAASSSQAPIVHPICVPRRKVAVVPLVVSLDLHLWSFMPKHLTALAVWICSRLSQVCQAPPFMVSNETQSV